MSNIKIDLHNKLKKQINQHIESSPNLTLREVSKSTDINLRTLSQYLKGNENLSVENVVKVLDWMTKESNENDNFFYTEFSELINKTDTEHILKIKIKNDFIEFCPLEMTKNSELKLKATYYNHDHLCFRALYVYQEKDAPNFIHVTEIITIPDNQSFLQAFLRQHQNGHALYRSDNSGEDFRKIPTDNPQVKVEYNSELYPTIKQMPLLDSKTNEPAIATLQFSKDQLTITAVSINQSSANPIRLIYRRID